MSHAVLGMLVPSMKHYILLPLHEALLVVRMQLTGMQPSRYHQLINRPTEHKSHS